MASLGQLIARIDVLQKARRVIIAVYRTLFRASVENQNLHLLNRLAPMSTRMRKIPSKIQSVHANQNTNYNPQCSSEYDSSDDNTVARIASTTVQIEPKNTSLQIGNTRVCLLIDSGSVCSILNESLANDIINSSTPARWLTTVPAQELKTFANEPIPIIGMMQTPVESKCWRIEDTEFVVVKD